MPPQKVCATNADLIIRAAWTFGNAKEVRWAYNVGAGLQMFVDRVREFASMLDASAC